MIYEGTYPSLIQGVSQQTPQERLDGQLGAQVNMLSDPVNGLRRRTGFKLHGQLNVEPTSKFDLVQLAGEYYIQIVTPTGRLVIVRFNDMEVMFDAQFPYLVHSSKGTIRSTLSRNQCFVLNTEQVPNKVFETVDPVIPMNPTVQKNLSWFTLTGAIKRSESETLVIRSNGVVVASVTVNYPASGPVTIATSTRVNNIRSALLAHSGFTAEFNLVVNGVDFAIWKKVNDGEDITYTYSTNSFGAGVRTARVNNTYVRSELPSKLPSNYNTYAVLVGGTQLVYDATRNLWVHPSDTAANLNPRDYGWVRIMSGAFSKTYTVVVEQGSTSLTFSVTTHTTTASQATPEYVATELYNAMVANSTFNSKFTVERSGTTLALSALVSGQQLTIESLGGETYITTSGASIIKNTDLLPPVLPPSLDGYIQGVGITGNLAYYQYSSSAKVWRECGVYEPRYTIQNTPMYWYFDYDTNQVVVESLDIQGRAAGDDNNNPEPAFMGFGFTGISAYQSRLILLSGAYVCMSKSTDPTVFMRTTVREVLDDDPIEISATALSNSQFEYAVPYNKDLVLFSSTQQAVIPASNAVLTPKSAVIYPSTQAEVSLAVRPTVASRSLYYVYQRGLDYYQIGELIPNPYTDAQYNPQNLTDHLPLYAEGVCTGTAGSSTNNMVAFSSDSPEVLINQFVWQGDQRSIMGFHKWVLPRDVVDVAFIQEYNVLFVKDTDDQVLVLTTNTQLNQLKDKPVPFLDIYQYVELDSNGEGALPFVPTGDLVAVVYDDVNYRHMEVQMTLTGNTVSCPEHAGGTIAVGLRYESSFTLTPPYLKDENGKVLAGVKSTVHSFPLTFKGTGEFQYVVHDFVGAVSSVDTSAAIWSEVNLGYTWINSIGTSVIPVRSRLDGLTCTVRTTSTTDLNLTTAGYVLRTAQKHRTRR